MTAVGAANPATAIPGQTVALESTGSSGDITSYAWTQVGGPKVTLNGANSDVATFVAPTGASTDLTFESDHGQRRRAQHRQDPSRGPRPIRSRPRGQRRTGSGAIVETNVTLDGTSSMYATLVCVDPDRWPDGDTQRCEHVDRIVRDAIDVEHHHVDVPAQGHRRYRRSATTPSRSPRFPTSSRSAGPSSVPVAVRCESTEHRRCSRCPTWCRSTSATASPEPTQSRPSARSSPTPPSVTTRSVSTRSHPAGKRQARHLHQPWRCPGERRRHRSGTDVDLRVGRIPPARPSVDPIAPRPAAPPVRTRSTGSRTRSPSTDGGLVPRPTRAPVTP